MNLNWIDISISLLLAVTTVRGFLRGFIRLIFDFMALILAIFLSFQWYKELSQYLEGYLKMPQNMRLLISFVLIWVLTYAVVTIIGNLVHKLIGEDIFSPLNFIGGGLIGLMKGLLIIWIILQLTLITPIASIFSKNLRDSQALKFISPVLQTLQIVFKTQPSGMPNISDFFEKKI